jgi:hypothetical protein
MDFCLYFGKIVLREIESRGHDSHRKMLSSSYIWRLRILMRIESESKALIKANPTLRNIRLRMFHLEDNSFPR